jgi:hypothetical protein
LKLLLTLKLPQAKTLAETRHAQFLEEARYLMDDQT